MPVSLASKKDMPEAIEIIAKSFRDNPSVNWVIKNDSKDNKRIRELARFSFKTALRRNGAYISGNRKGIALCYKYNIKKESLADYWDQLVLTFKCIGPMRVMEVLKRESYTKSKRPESGEFLYFWFYGVMPGFNGQGDALELKEKILHLADSEKLPIYLETSIEKNRTVYQRYGFETYHVWEVKERNINLYFMKREPEKISE